MAQVLTIKTSGFKELKRAFGRSPQVVNTEAKKYFIKSRAEILRTTQSNPWSVKGSGGGVPIDTGNLRQKWERTEFRPNEMRIMVDTGSVPYAKYVHGRDFGEINARTKVKSRPWLFYSFKKNKPKILKFQDELIKNVVKQLAK